MSTPSDPFDLERFVTAQQDVYERVRTELREGEKRSHWMWFIFPQLRGLGSSAMAQRYGIGSLAEARAYMAHPVLGPRLTECTSLVVAIQGRSLEQIFHQPDSMKFRSSMTLFERATADHAIFTAALERYCEGIRDPRTLALLSD